MGRGDRHRVRWAHDRQRRVKAREKREAEERAADRKSKKRGARGGSSTG